MRVYTTLLSSLSAGYPLYVYPLQREGKHFADAQITLPNYILQTFGISVQPDSQLTSSMSPLHNCKTGVRVPRSNIEIEYHTGTLICVHTYCSNT